MSVYRIAALAAAGLLVGGTFAASVLAQTPIIMPSKEAIKTFLKGLVVEGVPKVEIVVGTNHALATDAMVAGWISAKIASLAYTKQKITKVVNITPEEIESKIELKNKVVKLLLGCYETVYNVSYEISPLNATVQAKFNITTGAPVVDDIKYNLTAIIKDVTMKYDASTHKYYLTASGVEYKYVFYNASEEGANLSLDELKGAEIDLLGKKLKIADINATNITLQEVAATEQITVSGTLDLTKYGAPYKVEILDIVEFATNSSTPSYGLYFRVIDTKTGAVVKEDTMTKSEFESYINDLLKDYAIRVVVEKMAKSWVEGKPGYVVFSIVKGEFTLSLNDTLLKLSDEAAKVLGVNKDEWSYKASYDNKTLTITFIYTPSEPMKLVPGEEAVTLPAGLLTLHIVGKMPETTYTAYVYGGKLENATLDEVIKHLVGFTTINETDNWEVKVEPWNYTKDNKTYYAVNVSIIYKPTEKTALKLVYYVNETGQVEVIGPDGTVLIPAGTTGETYISEYAIYVRKPDTVTVEVRVPSDLPKITLARKVETVLKESKEVTLKEGQSTTVGTATVKVESIAATPVVKQGFTVKVEAETVKPKVFTPEELTKLVVTDEEWLKEAAEGKAPENAIAIGGQLVNKLVEALVDANIITPIKKGEERIELVNYELNGKTYKVLVLAGWDAELTQEAAKLLLQLYDEALSE